MKIYRYFLSACIFIFAASLAMIMFSLVMNVAAVLDGYMSNFTMFEFGLWTITISGAILLLNIIFLSLVLWRSPIKIIKGLINNFKVDFTKFCDITMKD